MTPVPEPGASGAEREPHWQDESYDTAQWWSEEEWRAWTDDQDAQGGKKYQYPPRPSAPFPTVPTVDPSSFPHPTIRRRGPGIWQAPYLNVIGVRQGFLARPFPAGAHPRSAPYQFGEWIELPIVQPVFTAATQTEAPPSPPQVDAATQTTEDTFTHTEDQDPPMWHDWGSGGSWPRSSQRGRNRQEGWTGSGGGWSSWTHQDSASWNHSTESPQEPPSHAAAAPASRQWQDWYSHSWENWADWQDW
jgi:hypothetical protein